MGPRARPLAVDDLTRTERLERAAAAGIRASPRGGGVVVELDDGERLNVLTTSRMAALRVLLDELAGRPRPRWVLLTGNGRGSFAAGADLAEIAGLDAAAAVRLSRAGGRVTERLARGPWPTAAVVDGHALGGGFDLAAACDVLVATPRARFAHPGIARGLFTGWGGTSSIPRRGRAGTLRAALLAGATLTAAEARQAGLASAVAGRRRAEDVAIAMLERLAGWGTGALDAWRAAAASAAGARVASALRRVDTPRGRC